MARTKTKSKARRNIKVHDEEQASSHVHVEPKEEDTSYLGALDLIKETRPLEPIEIKHRLGFFHRNGKNGKKTKVLRALVFTKEPYGFKEDKIEESKLKAAGITPVKDDQGDIYLVVKKVIEKGGEVLARWPEGIAYPKVPSAKLGRARNWDMVALIAHSRKPDWMKALTMGIAFIVIAVLILVFFLAYFFLVGGK